MRCIDLFVNFALDFKLEFSDDVFAESDAAVDDGSGSRTEQRLRRTGGIIIAFISAIFMASIM